MRIRSKLILAFSLLCAAALIASLVASFQAVQSAARARLESDAKRAVGQFEWKLRDLRELAEAQVGSFLLQIVYVRALELSTPRAAGGFGSAADDEKSLEQAHELFMSADLPVLKGGSQGGEARELVVLLNTAGTVIYNDAYPDAFGQSLKDVRIVKEALAGAAASDLWSSRYIRTFAPPLARIDPADPPDLFLVLAEPVWRGERVIGAILLGQQLTPGLLPQMERSLQGARLLIQSPDGAVATTFEASRSADHLEATRESVMVSLAGSRYLARAQAIHQDERPGSPVLGQAFVFLEIESELRRSLDAYRRTMLIGSAVVVAVAFLAIRYLTKRLAGPLGQLADAANLVREGDLTVQVTAFGRDEVGKLAAAFNEMVSGLRQREQIKGLFKRYLDPHVVDELIRHPEKASPGGERRHLTVLFSDLVGFTAFSERMSPEELVALLNRYFEKASHALAERGATLDKFIGDAIMCFWNAPLPQEDHAARACLAALDLLAVVERLRPELASRGVATFDCRIGINTGPCIVGNIGAENAQDYTVIGDTVNLASRLEGAAKVYGTRTLVSWETVESARGAVLARELDLLRVKGKAQPVRVFELVGRAGMARPGHLDVFAEGLALYRRRDFLAARGAFDSIAFDPPARLFSERCAKLLAEPPGEDWDGVHQLDTK